MRTRQVVPRELANRDIDEAIAYYLNQAGELAALGFINSLEQAYAHISRHPATGSTRYAHELGLPELRAWRLKHFPYLVFYAERHDHIDVWRVLHGKRDIPAWMEEST